MEAFVVDAPIHALRRGWCWSSRGRTRHGEACVVGGEVGRPCADRPIAVTGSVLWERLTALRAAVPVCW
jgi:hypothetical protein